MWWWCVRHDFWDAGSLRRKRGLRAGTIQVWGVGKLGVVLSGAEGEWSW